MRRIQGTGWMHGVAAPLAIGLGLALAPNVDAGECPNPNNSCFANNGTPGCNDPTCCAFVCSIDPFCCNDHWDNFCAGSALIYCAQCGAEGTSSCFIVHLTSRACNDPECCDLVCSLDSFCCTNQWDQLCVNLANANCCGGGGQSSCLTFDDTPGCEDPECCATVCAVDPFCCEQWWDFNCANEAAELCTNCGSTSAGSCFSVHNNPSCNNQPCCITVCLVDFFCCDSHWDDICVDEANRLCSDTCGSNESGNCYTADPDPSCSYSPCCLTVCADDPYCCDVQWDSLCVAEALEWCGGCGQPGAGSCTEAHASSGCNNSECCAIVCAIDTFCCNFSWDSICVDEAVQLCASCAQDCVTSDTFSPPADGKVDAADLAYLLGDWGVCAGCCGDTVTSDTFAPPPDGKVDAADLAAMLGAWGNPGCN